MQAIITKYHAATGTKGARVSAVNGTGKIQIAWDENACKYTNHRLAALKLLDEFKQCYFMADTSLLYSGDMPTGDGYAFVFVGGK